MSSQFNLLPTYQVQLTVNGFTSKDWYFFFQGLYHRLPPENVSPVTLGASPYTYTAPRGGTLIVTGGTVAAIAFSRDGVTFYSMLTAGSFPVGAADRVRITYTVAPTVTFVPL